MENRSDAVDQTEDIYTAKNASLKLSLDFVAYSADLYRRFFDWFMAKRAETYRTILDVGCDNGFVTCFLALMYPEARVLGVDHSVEGIRCAMELADKLNLSNVSFTCTDMADTQPFQSHSFDLIVSLRSLHEMVGPFPDIPHWSLHDLAAKHVNLTRQRPVESIRDALAQGGTFFSCERLVSNAPFYLWVHALREFGLKVDWTPSNLISFHEIGQQQRLPALVLKASPDGADEVEAIHQFYLANEDGEVRDGRQFNDALAEAVFDGIADKQFGEGIQLDYKDGSARLRSEIWRMPNHVLLYRYTDRGYRLLTVYPSDGEQTAAEVQRQLLEQTQHVVVASHYNEPRLG